MPDLEADPSWCVSFHSKVMSLSRRDLPAPLIAGAIAALVLFAGPADWLRGPSLDALLLLRKSLFDTPHSHEPPVAIVALDEETYFRLPFRGTPKALWTPEIARVLNAVLDGGASVVGFDLILPTSVETRLPGHDHPLLLALRRGGKQGRIVLARVQHQTKPISPFPGLAIAAGRGRNIRFVNVFSDPDGVVRRVPFWFRVIAPQGAVFEPSFSLEIAARHLGVTPDRIGESQGRLDGKPVLEATKTRGLLLNFQPGSATYPTHSLADLYACAKAGRADFFRKAFAGKVVLFGAVLDAEDRLLTSKRFIGGPERDRPAPRCVYPVMEELFRRDVRRQLIPGVVVQATAIDNIVRNDGLVPPILMPQEAIVIIFALVCAWLFQRLPFGWSVAVFLTFGAAWTIAAAYILRYGVVLPGLTLAATLIASAAVAVVYRYLVTDKDKRAIRRYFSMYLSPTIVDKLLAAGTAPVLGGEKREVTILISDIAGYTSLSENMPPERVVDFVNHYFTVAAGAVERHGGFVDKFMGDGMLAVFGALVDEPEHAAHAVAAALELQELTTSDGELLRPAGQPLRTRVGIATGPVVVGNIGSRTRLNYTVIGDTVNLAARLESENKAQGTSILVAEDTARAAGLEAFDFMSRVNIRGRNAEVAVYTPKRLPSKTDSPGAHIIKHSQGT